MNLAIAVIVAVAWLAVALLAVCRGGLVLGKPRPKPPGNYYLERHKYRRARRAAEDPHARRLTDGEYLLWRCAPAVRRQIIEDTEAVRADGWAIESPTGRNLYTSVRLIHAC